MTKSFSVLAIAAAALSAPAIMFSPAAYAAENSAQVSWHDLNLGTDAGQHTLAKRTEIAARKVCPDQQLTGSRLQSSSVRECRDQVRAQVAQRVSASGARVALRN